MNDPTVTTGSGPARTDDQRPGTDKPISQSPERDQKGRPSDAADKDQSKDISTKDVTSQTLTETKATTNNAQGQGKSDDRSKSGKPELQGTGAGTAPAQDRK